MNTRDNRTPTPPSEPSKSAVDLTETEDTRRALYDAAVATHFTPMPEEKDKAVADPESWQPPAYTPEQARLTVHQLYGRWFITWRLLEEKEGEVPPSRLWTVLRVLQDPDRGILEYHEV